MTSISKVEQKSNLTDKLNNNTSASSTGATENKSSAAIFEANKEVSEKKRKLTPEEESYIRANGLDPDNLSQTELTTCLNEYYNKKNKGNTVAQPQETTAQAESTTQNIENDGVQTTKQSNTPVAEKKDVTGYTVSINLQNDNMKKFLIEDNQIFDCNLDLDNLDFADVPEEEKQNLLVKSLAKYQLSQDAWKKMTPEEQAKFIEDTCGQASWEYFSEEMRESHISSNLGDKVFSELKPEEQASAISSVEAQLAETIPSWGKMTANDKIELARAFMGAGNLTYLRYNNVNPTDTFAEQIEKVIPIVIERRESKEYQDKALHDFDNAVLKFVNKTDGGSRGELSMIGNGDEVDACRYNYLKAKIAENNGDTGCLNDFEKNMYETYKVLEEKLPNHDLKVLGTYSQEKPNSTFVKMKNNDLYKDALAEASYRKKDDPSVDPENEAAKVYLKARMESLYRKGEDGKFYDKKTGKELSKSELKESYKSEFENLLNNCNIPQEKFKLLHVAYQLGQEASEYKNLSEFKDSSSAAVSMAAASMSKDAGYQENVANELAEKSDPKKKDYEQFVPIASHLIGKPNIFGEMKREELAPILIKSNNREVDEAYFEAIKDKTYTPDEQNEIGKVIYENKDGDYNIKTRVHFAENIGRLDESIQCEQVDVANSTGVAEVINGVATGLPKIHKDHQTYAAKSTMQASEKLDKKDAVMVQTTLANQVEHCDKDNQLDIHKTILTSQYEEVLQHATNNTSKYDESVQSEALKVSINTGNQKAIEAAAKVANEISLNKAATKSDNSDITNSSQIQKAIQDTEIKYQKNITLKVADTFANNNLDPGNVDVTGMTVEQKREYYIKEFENASIQKQYSMLSRLPISMKKDVYSKMAMYCPNMLKSIAGKYGADILTLAGSLPLDVIIIVAKAMLTSSGSARVDGAKFILKNDYFSQIIEKQAQEIVYGSNSSSNEEKEAVQKEQYATSPQLNDKFIKNTFASTFNDVNYKKVYKDLPPLRG